MGIVRDIQIAEKDLIESVVQTAQKQGIKINKKSVQEFARAFIEGEKLYIRGLSPCVYLDYKHNFFVLTESEHRLREAEAVAQPSMCTLIYNFGYINGSQKELFDIAQSTDKEFPEIWLDYFNANWDRLKQFIVQILYDYYYDTEASIADAKQEENQAIEKNKNINPNIYTLMEIMKRAKKSFDENKEYRSVPIYAVEILLYIAANQNTKKVYFEDLREYTGGVIAKVKACIYNHLIEYIEVSIDKKPNVKGPAKTVKLTEKGHEYIANLLDVLSGAPQTEPHAEGFSSGLPEARHADGFSSGLSAAPQTAGVSAGLSEAPQTKDVSVMSDDVAVAAI